MNCTVPQFLKQVAYLGFDGNRHQNNVTEKESLWKGVYLSMILTLLKTHLIAVVSALASGKSSLSSVW